MTTGKTSPLGDQVRSGRVLIAEPFMADPYFGRSVIMLCDHHEEGSLGFIVNKPLDAVITDLMEDFPAGESPVYYGGPVQTDTLHFLHTVGDLLEESTSIAPGIFWGGSFDKLKFLADNHLIHPGQVRFYVGYSGWSEGQLMEEMVMGSWILGDADVNHLFSEQPGKVWERMLGQKGGVYGVLSQIPEGNIWN